MIWAKLLISFGPNFLVRLGLTQNAFGPTLGPSFLCGLDLPPSIHQPATYSASIWVRYVTEVTKGFRRAGKGHESKGSNRSCFALRSEVAA